MYNNAFCDGATTVSSPTPFPTCLRTMPTITTPELQKMLGIQDSSQWQRIWGDAMAMFKAVKSLLDVQSWAKLNEALQDAMIIEALTLYFSPLMANLGVACR